MTVAFPAIAFFVRRDVVQIRTFDVGFPAAEYLSVRLEMDRETRRARRIATRSTRAPCSSSRSWSGAWRRARGRRRDLHRPAAAHGPRRAMDRRGGGRRGRDRLAGTA